jgi:hypothetical protein
MVSIESMISTSALYIAARYKLKNPKETVTDEDLKNYFDQMKREHVGKARPDVKQILKNVMLNVSIADPVGSHKSTKDWKENV